MSYIIILDHSGMLLELYSSTIFCSRYRQFIIMILAIISVIVGQCDRNNEIPYVQPQHDQFLAQKSESGKWNTMCMHAPNLNHYYYCFQKSNQNETFSGGFLAMQVY